MIMYRSKQGNEHGSFIFKKSSLPMSYPEDDFLIPIRSLSKSYTEVPSVVYLGTLSRILRVSQYTT